MIFLLFGCFILGGGVWVFNNTEFLAKSSFTHNLFSTVKEMRNPDEGHSRKAPAFSSDKRERSIRISRETASPTPPPSALTIKKVGIYTHPSGSQIWINRKFVAHSPSLVNVPFTEESVITVRKEGYTPRSFRIDTSRPFPPRLDITLRKITEHQPSKQKIRVID